MWEFGQMSRRAPIEIEAKPDSMAPADTDLLALGTPNLRTMRTEIYMFRKCNPTGGNDGRIQVDPIGASCRHERIRGQWPNVRSR